ncbi:tetratricopeptide repeat protein [Actinosynnema sp. NPDC023587]|uniref:tetratricopeptide repeat protein n=1 Tax=Actinosynnema sp. NPDC023587 TaxID=3154695 RepID=UPI0034119014
MSGPSVGWLDALAHLDELDGTAVISSIAGVGGIGTTWPALHWAHRNAHRFPDWHLFVDVRGFGPEADRVDPASAVRGFLEALGVDRDRIPVEPHAQTALFRTTVADRRLLLVVDNAANTGQVVPLLPGTRSCPVLVTSRNKMSGLVIRHGAHPVPLDVPTEDEARGLLVRHLGADRVAAEPEAVAELVARCGGFPPALGIIAGRARTDPGGRLAAVAAELRELGLAALDDDDPTAGLPDVLHWSCRVLPAEQARVFALLGIAPGPATDLRAAASLTGSTTGRTAAALRRVVDFYPQPRTRATCCWTRTAARCAWSPPRPAACPCRCPTTVPRWRGSRPSTRAWSPHDDALHDRMDDPIGRAIALNQVGWYQAKTGDHEQAREHCEAALALHRKHDNRDGEANTLHSLGYVHHHTGRYGEAAEHYREAINRYRELGDTYEIAGTWPA